MPYLFTLPGLLCGLALSIEDVRHRRVPIAWVAAGALLQLAADFAYGVVGIDLFVQARLFTVLCCLILFALALLGPRSLGFGDVTALIPMGLSVGLFGLLPVVVWWLAMGVAGITWIALWTRFDPQRTSPAHAGKVPYVPVILAGAIVAVVGWAYARITPLCPLCGQLPSARGANEVTTGFRLATCVVRPRSGHVHRRLRRTWFRRCPD